MFIRHETIEKNAFLMLLLTLLVISIGGIVEVIPLFTIETTVEHVERELNVGNFYVNRTLIGAVVGVQPFGGEGLSGTGPKAGGPHYLLRFATERVTSINTTAAGGNASLLMAASV